MCPVCSIACYDSHEERATKASIAESTYSPGCATPNRTVAREAQREPAAEGEVEGAELGVGLDANGNATEERPEGTDDQQQQQGRAPRQAPELPGE